jgi:hypothetical protein
MATLTCSVTGGLAQQWLYNSMNIGNVIAPVLNQVPEVPALPLVVDGVEFRLSLLSTTPDLASQITSVASENMDGRMVVCRTVTSPDVVVPPVLETTTLRVGGGSKWGRAILDLVIEQI